MVWRLGEDHKRTNGPRVDPSPKGRQFHVLSVMRKGTTREIVLC